MSWIEGKLIAIEGGDGSGKATQAELLFNALNKNQTATLFEFPRYKKSAFGELIKKSLTGEFGDFLSLSPYLSALPHMLDRVRAKYLLLEALKEGNVVCNRYTPSNLAHQTAKLPKKEKPAFLDFAEQGEYKELGLPKPDLVIYLWVPAETAKKLLLKRSKNKDRNLDSYEMHTEYQAKVVKEYLALAKKRKKWHIIKCTDSKGKLFVKSKIHKKILQIVKKELKIKL